MPSSVDCASLHGAAHHVGGLHQLAADLADRGSHFVGGGGGRHHIGGCFVRGLHRAFRALRGLAGCRKQRACRELHGGRALVHATQHGVHAAAESGDGALDHCAALFLDGVGGTFFLKRMLHGHVVMGRDQASVRKRLLSDLDHTAVGRGEGMRTRLLCRYPSPDRLDPFVDVAGKMSDGSAVLHDFPQCRTGFHHARRHAVHVDVAVVAEQQPAVRVP